MKNLLGQIFYLRKNLYGSPTITDLLQTRAFVFLVLKLLLTLITALVEKSTNDLGMDLHQMSSADHVNYEFFTSYQKIASKAIIIHMWLNIICIPLYFMNRQVSRVIYYSLVLEEMWSPFLAVQGLNPIERFMSSIIKDSFIFTVSYVDFVPAFLVFVVQALAKNLVTYKLLYGSEIELSMSFIFAQIIIILIFCAYLIGLQSGIQHLHNCLSTAHSKIKELKSILN